MEEITVNLTGCKSLYELHERLNRDFKFPGECGKNLDALWDSLRYYCSCDLCVRIKGVSTLPKRETFQDYMKKVFEIFDDVHDESPNITFEIVS